MSIEAYAARIAGNLNTAGQAASRLHLPETTPYRFRVAWALLRLAYDHAASIVSNFHHHGGELAGSPFALMRPMNEAFKRGAWFALCATDEETDDFVANDRVPQRNLAREIERHPPFDRLPMFSEQYANAWSKFHSFTHGGSQIVGAYTLGHGIGAAFPEADVIKALDHAEAIACTVVMVMCMVGENFDPENAHAAIAQMETIVPVGQQKNKPPT